MILTSNRVVFSGENNNYFEGKLIWWKIVNFFKESTNFDGLFKKAIVECLVEVIITKKMESGRVGCSIDRRRV
ncbi:hypothetical protein J8TS2_03480 [Lederbergia ruris]|uniref:Uncharacterized protein n=1 Tax=Lederbergia ruris TaxID=217495 RepID=A0ABQ4KDI9_9BACI|nr:hypothetical protein J8TS2_03480 [Lederbergia ruris]